MANVTQSNLNGFVFNAQNYLLKLFDKEVVFDEVVDSWPFMSTPWPVLSVLSVYLLFVLKIGPDMMKSRKPLNIKHVMLLYNAMQTLYNGWLVTWFFITPGAISYQINHTCHPLPRHLNQFLINELNKGLWYYFLSKVIDLLDTVFFVLRKKQSQITFLHLYHHVNMAFSTWFHLRYIKNEQILIAGVINTIIHTIMYSYYFLSALGPQVRKHLWWKKYLTSLQILQFVLVMLYIFGLFIFQCEFPKLFMIYAILDLLLFLYMFLKFYRKTYTKIIKLQ